MKKSLIFKNLVVILLVSSVTILSSCIKNRNTGATDFTLITPIVQIVEGGLYQFGNQALLFPATDPSDTTWFRLNYAAKTVAPTDIVLTIAVDNAALAAYNAANPLATYSIFPSNIYKLPFTSITIKAGQTYSDPVPVVIYPVNVDPSKNLMLPITITAASGVNISSNFGTIYYHFIGNCLAGTYNDVGTRYNYVGVIGWTGGAIPPATGGSSTIPGVKTIAPVSATVSTTFYSNLGAGTSRDYYFTYDCSVGGTNIDATLSQSFLDGTSNVLFVTHSYNPALKQITMLSTYNNQPGGAGNDRIISEVLTHQ